MTPRTSGTRRLARTVLGALGGLLGGLGATVVFTQSGRVGVDVATGISLATVILGAVIGFAELPRWIGRIVAVALVLCGVGVTAAGFAEPVDAQTSCTLSVTFGGDTFDLAATTRGDPIVVDVGAEPTLVFDAQVPGVERGLVQVVVVGISPVGPFELPGDRAVFAETITDGTARAEVRIESAGWSGFETVFDGQRAPVVPLGLIELDVTVLDVGRDAIVDGCPATVWIRAVARPAGNPLGQAGLGATGLGLLLLALAGPARRWVGLGPRAAPGPEVSDQTPVPAPTAPPAPKPPVPAAGPHLAHTDVRILDATGAQVDPALPLLAGREYRIAVTFGLGPAAVDERREPVGLTVAAASNDVAVDGDPHAATVGAPATVSIVPSLAGRQRVSIDAMYRGNHVQTERVEFSVVTDPTAGIAPPAPSGLAPGGQTTTTLITSAEPTREFLDRLLPRQVVIVLEVDPHDHTVDARIRDGEGNTIVRYDSPLVAAALDEAATEVRDALSDALAVGGGDDVRLDDAGLSSSVAPVVAAGQRLSMALFPDTGVADGDVEALAALVADGATVQVVANGAGLGHATLPWGLVYDHPFVARASGNAVCPSFATHPIDACPSRSDLQVWCPTGFWGMRSVVEELWSSTEHGVLAPPVPPPAGGSPGGMVVYLDDALSATPAQVRATSRFGATRLRSFDEVLDWLGTDHDDVSLVYLYAHHHEGAAGGVLVGDDVLSAGTLNAVRAHRVGCWPRQPLVIVNGCASGAYRSSDPVSMIDELRAYGAGGAVTSECALWDPLAGECGLRLLDAVSAGRPIGPTLLEIRRDLLVSNRNPIGLALRLQARSDTVAEQTTLPPPDAGATVPHPEVHT